jgi:hypothetical protein
MHRCSHRKIQALSLWHGGDSIVTISLSQGINQALPNTSAAFSCIVKVLDALFKVIRSNLWRHLIHIYPISKPGAYTTDCSDGGFIDDKFKLGTAASTSNCSYGRQVHGAALSETSRSPFVNAFPLCKAWKLLCVNLQDSLPASHIGEIHLDYSIKTTGTNKGGVKDLLSIRSRHHTDSSGGIEAIHAGQELIQGLFCLVVATKACWSSTH